MYFYFLYRNLDFFLTILNIFIFIFIIVVIIDFPTNHHFATSGNVLFGIGVWVWDFFSFILTFTCGFLVLFVLDLGSGMGGGCLFIELQFIIAHVHTSLLI